MTIEEAIKKVETDGVWTDENMNDLSDAVKNTEFESFSDPNLKQFLSFINTQPYHDKIQDIVTSIATRMSEKGVDIPCMSGCSDECAFHDMEFGR